MPIFLVGAGRPVSLRMHCQIYEELHYCRLCFLLTYVFALLGLYFYSFPFVVKGRCFLQALRGRNELCGIMRGRIATFIVVCEILYLSSEDDTEELEVLAL